MSNRNSIPYHSGKAWVIDCYVSKLFGKDIYFIYFNKYLLTFQVVPDIKMNEKEESTKM